MADIICKACGRKHRYTATALKTLVEASQAGELHTVGVGVNWLGESVVEVRPRCLLTVALGNMRPSKTELEEAGI